MKKMEAELTCPKCEAVFAQVVEEMRPGTVRQCPNCGVDIQFSGDDGTAVQKALDDLDRTFKNLFHK